MKEILRQIELLLEHQPSFKGKMTALANDAGIDLRSKAGVPHDLFEIFSKNDKLLEMTYVEFIIVMLTLVVRSYMDKDDSAEIEELNKCFNKYFDQMTTAERLFYAILKFRLGEVRLNQ